MPRRDDGLIADLSLENVVGMQRRAVGRRVVDGVVDHFAFDAVARHEDDVVRDLLGAELCLLSADVEAGLAVILAGGVLIHRDHEVIRTEALAVVVIRDDFLLSVHRSVQAAGDGDPVLRRFRERGCGKAGDQADDEKQTEQIFDPFHAASPLCFFLLFPRLTKARTSSTTPLIAEAVR